MKKALLSLFAVLALWSGPVSATQYVTDAYDKGWYFSDGLHYEANKNTNTGFGYSGGLLRQSNSFFIFDLAGFGGDATSALLELELESYFSIDPTESFSVYDVSTSPTDLSLDQLGAVDIYNDLMTGSVYGSATVSTTDVGSIIQIALSSQALADINNTAGGQFAIGVSVTSLSYNSENETVRFNKSLDNRVQRLTLDATPVPEPSTVLLMLSGLAGLGYIRFKSKKKK